VRNTKGYAEQYKDVVVEDALVYKLYELTEEEIAIVEGSHPHPALSARRGLSQRERVLPEDRVQRDRRAVVRAVRSDGGRDCDCGEGDYIEIG
jgi:hypothetical protein